MHQTFNSSTCIGAARLSKRPLLADAALFTEAVPVEPLKLEALLPRLLHSLLLLGMGIPATANDLTMSASSCSAPNAAASCT